MPDRLTSLCIVGVITACLSATSQGKDAKQPTLPELVFSPGGAPLYPGGPGKPNGAVIQFKQAAAPTTDGQVMGGGPFDPKRLPATFMAEFSDKSICTATLIGPRVLLTAAHCLDMKMPAAGGGWQTASGGITLTGAPYVRRFKSCEMADAYTASPPPIDRRPRNANDFALCEMGEDVPVRAETIALNPALVRPTKKAMFAGFGCTEAQLAKGTIPDYASAARTLNAAVNIWRAAVVEKWATMIGRVGKGEGIVCPGDSGGAVYSNADITPLGSDDGWRVVAVVSAVGPSEKQLQRWNAKSPSPNGVEYVSYFSPLSSPQFGAFLSQFQSNHRGYRKVCGIDLPAGGAACRP